MLMGRTEARAIEHVLLAQTNNYCYSHLATLFCLLPLTPHLSAVTACLKAVLGLKVSQLKMITCICVSERFCKEVLIIQSSVNSTR